IPKQAKGGYDDLIPKQQKKGAYDDLIPKVSPDILAKARSGNISAPVDPSIIARQKMPQPNRAVPSADMAMAPTAERPLTAQNEPSIAARQPQRPPTFAEAAKVTAKWLALKAAHGYDWARHLSPALASDAMTNMTDWTLNKAQDMATEVFRRAGADNPETMGHELVSLVVDLGMYRAGEGPPVEMGVGAAGEAAIEKALKTPEAVADTRPGRAAAAGEAAVGEALKTPESPLKTAQTGQEAFKEGRRLYDNPHPEDSPEYDQWRREWSGAFKDSGRGGRFGVPAGAAATPTHEILAANVRAKEATLTATDPTFKQNMRLAANKLKSVFSPETSRDIETGEQTGLKAAANIREKIGVNTREKQQASQALNQYYKTFNGVSAEEGLQVLDWLQNPASRKTGPYQPTPEVEGFMKTFGDRMMKVQRILETIPSLEGMKFRENFVSGLWQNPEVTMPRLMGKAGSNYFTKAKVWESYREGISQGGIPISTNPLEIGLRYIENAHNLITRRQIIDDGEGSGMIVRRADGDDVPNGWVPLKGQDRAIGNRIEKAYAPQAYAEVYNNYVSMKPQGWKGDLLGSIQRMANVTTQVNLGLSGFHADLMMQESMASGIANAIDNIAGGKVLTGFAKMGEASIPGLYAATSIVRAKKGIAAYFDDTGTVGNFKTQKA